MNKLQLVSYKEGLNKALKTYKAELHISSESNSSGQYAANLSGRIKGIEFALELLNDVLDNG